MSLRIRVALLVSVLTIVILSIAGSAIHRLTEADIRTREDSKLSWQVDKVSDPLLLIKILQVGRFYRGATGAAGDGSEQLSKLLDVQIPTRILVGSVPRIETRGFPDLPVLSLSNGFSEIDRDGKHWRVKTAVLSPRIRGRSSELPNNIVIQAAITRDSITTTLQDFRDRFILIGILTVIGAGISGWFVGGVILQPITHLRKHTENVRDSQDLSQRVPEKLGPAEVESLAKSLNEMLAELELNVEQTEQALRSSRSFASNVAHELRTPLTSMKMNLDLLARYPRLDTAERSRILADVSLEQDRLLSTLESLRLLSRSDLSEHDVFEEIDFAQLIQEAVERHKRQWEGVNFQLQLPSEPPLVYGWREGLTVLFRNVIENACVHSRMSKQDLTIDISIETHDTELKITIDDNGVGIPESERDQVLGRFSKGSQSMGSGSGLGLSLVQQQAELHGGSVRLLNSPSGGARVSIILPVIL